MMGRDDGAALRMCGSVFYCIQIDGVLDAGWLGRLGGLTMTVQDAYPNRPITNLCGQVADQAALLDVLNTLYNLRLPLLSVERRDCAPHERTVSANRVVRKHSSKGGRRDS